MPLFEFRCVHCKECFESIIFASEEAAKVLCPHCESDDTERLLSCFSAKTSRGESAACGPPSTDFG